VVLYSCAVHKETVINAVINGVCHVGLRWWVKRKNRGIVEEKKRQEIRKTYTLPLPKSMLWLLLTLRWGLTLFQLPCFRVSLKIP
jgi:hypothetical protein